MQLSTQQPLSCPNLQFPYPGGQQSANITGLDLKRPRLNPGSAPSQRWKAGKSPECRWIILENV